MNPREWDELLERVRKQITDMRSTLAQNETTAKSQKETLEEAKRTLEQLIENPANPREVFYQLPLVLSALTIQKLIGIFLIGNDGKVVMHHGSGQRLLGIDPISNKLPSGCFLDSHTGKVIAEDDLPWQRCLRGDPVNASTHLVIRDEESNEQMHVDVSAVPLTHDGNVSGVIILFRDVTEIIKADEYIKALCRTLERQLSGMESAQRELKILADKLGAENWAGEPAGTPQIQQDIRPSAEKKVLVVDDIPVNQKLLVMHLKKLNVETDVANNGLEAVNACRCKRYALVLMDLDMPILDGYEATSEIRKFESRLGVHTPIVAVTSFDRAGDKYKCLRAGMDDFIGKSASKNRLREIIAQYVFEEPPAAVEKKRTAEEKLPADDLKLDFAWLKETLGEESNKVISLFFGSAESLLNCLEYALEDKDLQSVNHFAFSLKGPCSSLGLDAMAKTTASLVDSALDNDWNMASEKMKGLRQMFSVVKAQAMNCADPQLLESIREAAHHAGK
jgi:CheY-like chemotaxis protein/HPt (histidine-containing phosphotransfer) domain-containing protein